MSDTERQPLLTPNGDSQTRLRSLISPRKAVATIVLLAFIIGTAVLTILTEKSVKIPRDPHVVALSILNRHPLLDTHIDLPFLVRLFYKNNATSVNLEKPTYGQVDIDRLRQGHVGGFFWSVYTNCPPDHGKDDFLTPTDSVRDTLEQIDIAKELINRYPSTFKFATTASGIRSAMASGKIASVLGIEGGHQLGNSLAALRQFFDLGVRYVTLTHSCHNAFADSAGIFTPIKPLHHGLSLFGQTLIHEMNRLGMIIDVSHTSDDTTIQAIKLSKAPVIWSHSSARSVWNVPRNVPDNILKMIGTTPDKRDAVVQINFLPGFVAAEGNATVVAVADHVDHIGKVAGRQHVGLGSDFDGMAEAPKGLEDVSKYPNLFAELYKRGWTPGELEGLAGDNFLRVFAKIEAVAHEMRHEVRAEDIYGKRTDL